MSARTLRWSWLLVLPTLLAFSCRHHSGPEPSPLPCAYTLSATSLAFEATGGMAQITVTTTASCSWTAQSGAAWLTIAGGAGVTGTGTVQVSATANPATTARSGAVTIAGQSVQATQTALPPCTYRLSPESATVDQNGGAGGVAVDAAANCAWTATSSMSWLTLTGGASGTGNGSVSYLAARNQNIEGRSATITVADQTFALSQAGDVLSCQYSVSPVDFSPCMAQFEMTSTIATEAACPWTASTSVPWLTPIGAMSGSGPAVLRFEASSNYDAPRLGQILVRWPAATAGQNLRVAQAGCYYAVSKDTFSFAAGGGSGSFDVIQQSDPYTCGGPLQNGCVWSAVADVPWITITSSMPRVGDDPVGFTVAANATGAARSGTITVRNKVVRVTQGG
jgi:Viral BACON domain/Putative binding domain, N-terminal